MLKDQPLKEEAIVVTAETKALINKAIKPKKKRVYLGLTDEARRSARDAKHHERHCPATKLGWENLLRLADKLDGVGPYVKDGPIPYEKFDLVNWLEKPALRENPDDVFGGTMAIEDRWLEDLTNRSACGTVACACGWAATDEYFTAQGLSFKKAYNTRISLRWEDINDVFNLGHDRSGYLFSRGKYTDAFNTPKGVSTRIRHFLASKYFDDVRPK